MQSLLERIGGALELLEQGGVRVVDNAPAPSESLSDLVLQAERLTAGVDVTSPLRGIYHFACAGGTLISRCIGALPNVTTLSEVDPLNDGQLRMGGAAHQFRPSDLVYCARMGVRPVDNHTVLAMFRAELGALHENVTKKGGYVLVRAHTHTQYCTQVEPRSRPTMHAVLQEIAPVRALITVRHPLDSYVSLVLNRWRQFEPPTLNEYSRRYGLFLDDHVGLEIVRYEEFAATPDMTLERMCALLDLPFVQGMEDLYGLVKMSGDSGRKSSQISLRPRRPVPEDILSEVESSAGYRSLCERLGYNPAANAEAISGDAAASQRKN